MTDEAQPDSVADVPATTVELLAPTVFSTAHAVEWLLMDAAEHYPDDREKLQQLRDPSEEACCCTAGGAAAARVINSNVPRPCLRRRARSAATWPMRSQMTKRDD